MASPSEPVPSVFARLHEAEVATVPIVEEGRLVGVITLENMTEYMMIHAALPTAGTEAAKTINGVVAKVIPRRQGAELRYHRVLRRNGSSTDFVSAIATSFAPFWESCTRRPLLVALVFIEVSDIIFAVDSVPAIFAITSEPLIVFTSNVFAILGMRALYFLLAGVAQKFRLLKYALGTILVFVGSKMAWLNEAFGGKFPISWSLAIIAFILIFFLVLSLTSSSRAASAKCAGVSEQE